MIRLKYYKEKFSNNVGIYYSFFNNNDKILIHLTLSLSTSLTGV